MQRLTSSHTPIALEYGKSRRAFFGAADGQEFRRIGWIAFFDTGTMWVAHGDGMGGEGGSSVGTYVEGQPIEFLVGIDLDASTFNVLMNEEIVLMDAPFIDVDASVQFIRFGTHTAEPRVGPGPNRYAFDDFALDALTPVQSVTWGDVKATYRRE